MRTNDVGRFAALGVAFVLACIVSARAQQSVRPKIPPPDFQRECEADAAGLLQWKPYDVECPQCKGVKSYVCQHCKDTPFPICQECDGEKRAPCRVCGGRGKMPDPLVELACPFCQGSAWYPCGLCNGFGTLKVDQAETKCGACKQKGLFECTACAGTRRVDAVKIKKKGVGEASAKDLEELLVRLRASASALDRFEPETNPAKSQKAFAKALEPIEHDLEVVEDVEKMLDAALKGLKSYGAGYTSYEENLKGQFFLFKDRSVFLLQHQIRAAEQSLERARANQAK
jgi:hypothetical protein